MSNHLTGRQKTILHQLLLGKMNKQIAEAMKLGEQTVKNEVQDVLAYFGVTRTRQLFPIIDRVRRELEVSRKKSRFLVVTLDGESETGLDNVISTIEDEVKTNFEILTNMLPEAERPKLTVTKGNG